MATTRNMNKTLTGITEQLHSVTGQREPCEEWFSEVATPPTIMRTLFGSRGTAYEKHAILKQNCNGCRSSLPWNVPNVCCATLESRIASRRGRTWDQSSVP
mmetsp:Transcript_22266/g.48362  ORF Transcript_22266/g.48362 Transcript_22266/m.48362 type:complete len:101 (+) Transcript_22266:1912-2214(+)